jgi:hypothetical protein
MNGMIWAYWVRPKARMNLGFLTPVSGQGRDSCAALPFFLAPAAKDR